MLVAIYLSDFFFFPVFCTAMQSWVNEATWHPCVSSARSVVSQSLRVPWNVLPVKPLLSARCGCRSFLLAPYLLAVFFFAAKSLFFPSFLIALFSLCSELLHRGSFPVSRTTYLCSSWFRARVCKRPGMCGLHGLAEVWKHRFFRVRVPTFLFFFFFSLLGVSPLHHFSFFPFH